MHYALTIALVCASPLTAAPTAQLASLTQLHFQGKGLKDRTLHQPHRLILPRHIFPPLPPMPLPLLP